jgi:hypothetical protein
MKTAIGGMAVAAALMCAAPEEAKADVTAEAMVGQDHATLDLKVGGALTEDLGVFTRQTLTIDREGKVGYFGLGDLQLHVGEGVDLIAEGQFVPGGEFQPRLGIGYFIGAGDLTHYTQATVNPQGDVYCEIFTATGFKPEIAEGVDLVLELETITDFADEFIFAKQGLRAGLGIGDVEFGAAADLVETPDTLGYNIGGFVKTTL